MKLNVFYELYIQEEALLISSGYMVILGMVAEDIFLSFSGIQNLPKNFKKEGAKEIKRSFDEASGWSLAKIYLAINKLKLDLVMAEELDKSVLEKGLRICNAEAKLRSLGWWNLTERRRLKEEIAKDNATLNFKELINLLGCKFLENKMGSVENYQIEVDAFAELKIKELYRAHLKKYGLD